MNPHYYLMKSKKILRLEEDESFTSLPLPIRLNALDQHYSFNQEQANWRVVIFRDEIMDLGEYLEWMNSPESVLEEEAEFELAAN